ncbi:MAG: ComEC/Rec2 family competence protein [Bacillota bacterium]
MIIMLLLALALSTSTPPSLLKNTSELSQSFQQKCSNSISPQTENPHVMASLICGEKLTDEILKQNLVKTSLIHIFVISGSHLILLDELLSILKIPVLLRFLLLGFYSLVVGWQPPAVRALVALGVRLGFKKMRWNFPPDLLALIAGLITLTLFREWWQSNSLLMSWCAALALCWAPLLRIKNRFAAMLLSQLAIYLFMIAPLWGFGSLHPLSLLFNVCLGPAVSFILLPSAAISMVIPALSFLFDSSLSLFSKLIAVMAEPISLNSASPPSLGLLWCWILAWQLFFHGLRLRLYQGKEG